MLGEKMEFNLQWNPNLQTIKLEDIEEGDFPYRMMGNADFDVLTNIIFLTDEFLEDLKLLSFKCSRCGQYYEVAGLLFSLTLQGLLYVFENKPLLSSVHVFKKSNLRMGRTELCAWTLVPK
jgi:hypothetical protein